MTDETQQVDPDAFKKDELVAAAEIQGVEVEKGDTKADIAEKLSDARASGPVHVDQFSRRSDADAFNGSFVRVLEGEHAGQLASFVKTLEWGADGYPTRIWVRFKDATHTHEYAAVDYANVRMVHHPGFLQGELKGRYQA